MSRSRAGFASATGVLDESTPEFRSVLEQNAPNPFTAWSKVSYRLEEAGPVSVVLYDVMGRKVRTLLNGVQSEGDHELELHGEGLPSGIYYYRLTVNGRHFERKCVVVR